MQKYQGNVVNYPVTFHQTKTTQFRIQKNKAILTLGAPANMQTPRQYVYVSRTSGLMCWQTLNVKANCSDISLCAKGCYLDYTAFN